jgi:hypothetical protein
MHMEYNVEDDVTALLDYKDVEQIILSWHLIQECDPDFIDHMEKILDKRWVFGKKEQSNSCHVGMYLGLIVIVSVLYVYRIEFPRSCLVS